MVTVFNKISPRYSEAIRRISTLQRQYGSLLAGAIYRPHVPFSLHDGVYVSEFGNPEAMIYMVVNRNGDPEGDRDGDIVRLPCVTGARYEYVIPNPSICPDSGSIYDLSITRSRYFDVYHGHEMTVECIGASANLRFRIEALGFVSSPPPHLLLTSSSRKQSVSV